MGTRSAVQGLRRYHVGLSAVVLVVSWQVFSRYITSASASWAPELAQLVFVWTALFAIAIGVRQRKHMVVDAFSAVKNRTVNAVLNTFSSAVVVAVSLTLAWFGYDSLAVSFRRDFPALGVSTGWMHLAVPIAFLACAIFAAEAWFRTVVLGEEKADEVTELLEEAEEADELMETGHRATDETEPTRRDTGETPDEGEVR